MRELLKEKLSIRQKRGEGNEKDIFSSKDDSEKENGGGGGGTTTSLDIDLHAESR